MRNNYALIKEYISMSHIIKNELKLLKGKIMENPQLRNDSQLNKQTNSLIECATKKSNIPKTY